MNQKQIKQDFIHLKHFIQRATEKEPKHIINCDELFKIYQTYNTVRNMNTLSYHNFLGAVTEYTSTPEHITTILNCRNGYAFQGIKYKERPNIDRKIDYTIYNEPQWKQKYT